MPKKKSADEKKTIVLDPAHLSRFDSPENTLRYLIDVLKIEKNDISKITGLSYFKLTEILAGRRPMEDELLTFLGWERVVTYRRIQVALSSEAA